MTDFLNYLVPGITDGSVYALCALGLVLTYKTSGVFNFAYGAQAAVAAYLFYEFHDLPARGWLRAVLPNQLAGPYPWPVAFGIGLLLIGVLGGLALERLATLLSGAPTVRVVVATVGLLVLLQSLMTAIFGAADLTTPDYLPTSGFRLGDVQVSWGDVLITGFCMAAAGGLFAFFNRTRLGKATTAVVDDPDLLALARVNPVAIRRFSWVLGSSFAAIAGMLLAPKLGVSVNTLVLIVIAAYGAAAIGLFENLRASVIGAFAIGVAINYLPQVAQRLEHPLFGRDNQILEAIPRNVPFVVLLAVFLVVPAGRLTERGVRHVRRAAPLRTFAAPVTAAGLAALSAVLLAVPHLVRASDVNQYSALLGYAIIFLSLGMLTWQSGQISSCHMGFAALGATCIGHLSTTGFWRWLPLVGGHTAPWPVALFLAGLVAVPFGALVAVPATRLAGIYVAIATFGFGIVLQYIVYPMWLFFGIPPLVQVPRPGSEVTSFPTGQTVHTRGILGQDFVSDTRFYYLALVVAMLMAALVLLVRRGRLGSLLRAMADSPVALQALGANTTTTRVLVFCLAAWMAGVGGAILSSVPESASGTPGGVYDYTFSLIIVAVLGICGRRPVLSPVLAAALFTLPKIYPPFDDPNLVKYQGVFFGAAAIVVAVWPAVSLNRLYGTRRHVAPGPVGARSAQPPVRPVRVLHGVAR